MSLVESCLAYQAYLMAEGREYDRLTFQTVAESFLERARGESPRKLSRQLRRAEATGGVQLTINEASKEFGILLPLIEIERVSGLNKMLALCADGTTYPVKVENDGGYSIAPCSERVKGGSSYPLLDDNTQVVKVGYIPPQAITNTVLRATMAWFNDTEPITNSANF